MKQTTSLSNLRPHAWFGRRDSAFAEILLCAELGPLHHVPHLILTTAPQGRYYYAHFTDQRTKAQWYSCGSGHAAAQYKPAVVSRSGWRQHSALLLSPGSAPREPLIPHIFITWAQSAVSCPTVGTCCPGFFRVKSGTKMGPCNAYYPLGAFGFMKPFPSSALLTTPTPQRLCMAPSSSSSRQLCGSEGRIKY